VKQLLRCYEKFRGGVSPLNEKFLDSLQSEQQKLRELANVQASVDVLDEQRLDEIHVLQNYKEKEIRVKEMRLLELLKEIDRFEANCTENRSEPEQVVDVELAKLHGAELSFPDSNMAGESERGLMLMHPSLKDTALANQVVERETDAQAESIRSAEHEIEWLSIEVGKMLGHPSTNICLHLFPEFLRTQATCSPDDEIVLDIERLQRLPI